jgi:hypothetical protein
VGGKAVRVQREREVSELDIQPSRTSSYGYNWSCYELCVSFHW